MRAIALLRAGPGFVVAPWVAFGLRLITLGRPVRGRRAGSLASAAAPGVPAAAAPDPVAHEPTAFPAFRRARVTTDTFTSRTFGARATAGSFDSAAATGLVGGASTRQLRLLTLSQGVCRCHPTPSLGR